MNGEETLGIKVILKQIVKNATTMWYIQSNL